MISETRSDTSGDLRTSCSSELHRALHQRRNLIARQSEPGIARQPIEEVVDWQTLAQI